MSMVEFHKYPTLKAEVSVAVHLAWINSEELKMLLKS